MKQVKIGQKWQRPNGAIVEVTEERMVNGMRDVRLVPVSGPRSRASWKWEQLVMADMSLVEEEKQ